MQGGIHFEEAPSNGFSLARAIWCYRTRSIPCLRMSAPAPALRPFVYCLSVEKWTANEMTLPIPHSSLSPCTPAMNTSTPFVPPKMALPFNRFPPSRDSARAAGAIFGLRKVRIRNIPILCDLAHSNNAMSDFVIVRGALLSSCSVAKGEREGRGRGAV